MPKKHIGVSIYPESVIAIRVNALRAQHDIGWAAAFERLGEELIEENKQHMLELTKKDKRTEDLNEAFEGCELKVRELSAELSKLKGENAQLRAILSQIAPDLAGVEQEEKYALLFVQLVRMLNG